MCNIYFEILSQFVFRISVLVKTEIQITEFRTANHMNVFCCYKLLRKTRCSWIRAS